MAKPAQQDARLAALTALNAVDSGSHADRALNRALAGVADARDRALASELVYGILRRRMQLDSEIVPCLRKTNPALLNLLRIGLYQLRYLERVPAYAAVNSVVDLAKKEGYAYASNMINAVLRRLERNGPQPLPAGDDVKSLAMRFSHPEWLVRGWLDQLGLDQTKALLEADQSQAGLTLRIRRGEAAAAVTSLQELGLVAGPGRYAANSVRVESGNPHEWPALQTGDWVLQDEAAQTMAALLPPAAEHLDLCAAPGGKAFLLADRDGAKVLAVDNEASRLDDLRALTAKLGLGRQIEPRLGDARTLELGRTFASVLVDAPCSGLGTLRRNPDRKWKPAPPHELARLQGDILRRAARHVAPGGHLLYVTCTIWAPENEGVVKSFEGSHPGWSRVRSEGHPFLSADGLYRSRPDIHGVDGFFAALWQAPSNP
jgi:16S rRNA (cytosine967-C5)-methyltransferase